MSNKLMEVKLSNFGTLNVNTNNNMVKLDNIIRICNGIDSTVTTETVLSGRNFWYTTYHEYRKLLAGTCKFTCIINTDDLLDLTKNTSSNGNVNYDKLIHNFPGLIDITNQGIWVSTKLLPVIVANSDSCKLVELIMFNFAENDIVKLRTSGAKSFKRLAKLIDTLDDRSPMLYPEGNKECYIEISRIIKRKLSIDNDTFTWDGISRNLKIHTKRTKLQKDLCRFIETGLVRTYEELKVVLTK